jgi:hypothetical protein
MRKCPPQVQISDGTPASPGLTGRKEKIEFRWYQSFCSGFFFFLRGLLAP